MLDNPDKPNSLSKVRIFTDSNPQLMESIDDFVGEIEPQDCLLLVGSVVDGLNHSASDVDLLYIGNKRIPGDVNLERSLFEETYKMSDPQIGIDCWTRTSIAKLGERLRRTNFFKNEFPDGEDSDFSVDGYHCDKPSRPTASYRLYNDEFVLIHRINSGVSLKNDETISNLRRYLFCEHLDKMIVYAVFSRYGALKKDAINHVSRKDYTAAAAMMRSAMEGVADAFLASHQVVNLRDKWKISLLNGLGPEREGVLSHKIVECLIPLHGYNPQDYIEYASEVADEALVAIGSRYRNVVDWVLSIAKRQSIPDSEFSAHSHINRLRREF